MVVVIFNIKIGLDCPGCSAPQLSSAPLVALIGSRTFKVEASNTIKDQLRRSRWGPITVEGEAVQGADGFRQGTLAVSRIVQAQAPALPPVAVEAARPTPAFRAAVERGPIMSLRAPTVRQRAVRELLVPPPPPGRSVAARRQRVPRDGPLNQTELGMLLSHLKGVVGR